jgi:starch synthase
MPSGRWPRISDEIRYEEKTAWQMLAESDFLLMPSRFEPCELTQMYTQRFGLHL